MVVQGSCVRSHGLRPIFSTTHGYYDTGNVGRQLNYTALIKTLTLSRGLLIP
ncbi:hypothetical protein HanRHA438_Chr05g0208011 [Helianthus annuus]|uniref:Uncharacterized protein n=1 Tax=Helianthus annuus TaxID=4232 RepID=A0A251ULP7_HELAN|nr:hypothetical protein HanXRQr2_Chr05g0198411 [Helianthus annuus]KAJ0569164.1 hypothetical protein HanHA300_Chr05g0162921 [Helianthus annuus]KAJ0583460.1 hypothetical protein HanHA89_Chr05g0176811 [Helianthus annuus]KAJ0746195.1 hypothetical protein HanOQP8_Chr05g0174731 [Helianthus annuus]KAJ0917617.1 hypothetical protein HanRHA438_Chr05g0208011 [Helianthus annuus]